MRCAMGPPLPHLSDPWQDRSVVTYEATNSDIGRSSTWEAPRLIRWTTRGVAEPREEVDHCTRARRRLALPTSPTLTLSSRRGLPGLCPGNPAGLCPDPDPLTAWRDRAVRLPLA
jgi:hypothetical protein